MTNTELKAQIDSQVTNKTAQKSITASQVGVNTKAVVDYVDQQVGIFNEVKLLLSQSATSAPTAIVARNNFSANPTYSRVSAGKFNIIMPSGSLTGKTLICHATSSTDTPLRLSINQTGASTIGLWALDSSGAFTDNLTEISITIQAY
ncbi:hypothetical protein PHG11b_37 [Flavobacterium phage 11b]|uniref:hypothetical protein n=1 Tax=Flavobacterium phage 11b TaxID=294631 RepID=UPI0000444143|nr:hypothetical protein PHG11b_37 [Flavobacterium phage 11b]CAH56664.1 hypothetical protein PHG11b_37 [Flavobacterium phage 11b]